MFPCDSVNTFWWNLYFLWILLQQVFFLLSLSFPFPLFPFASRNMSRLYLFSLMFDGIFSYTFLNRKVFYRRKVAWKLLEKRKFSNTILIPFSSFIRHTHKKPPLHIQNIQKNASLEHPERQLSRHIWKSWAMAQTLVQQTVNLPFV